MGTTPLQALRDELAERFGPDWRGACFGRNISNLGLGLPWVGYLGRNISNPSPNPKNLTLTLILTCFGRATHFLSHSWGLPFNGFIQALTSVPRRPFAWRG